MVHERKKKRRTGYYNYENYEYEEIHRVINDIDDLIELGCLYDRRKRKNNI